MNLPELEVSKRVEYLKFKNLRNLHKGAYLKEEELKTLNLEKLVEIVDT
jgi:hypothetical protein